MDPHELRTAAVALEEYRKVEKAHMKSQSKK